MDKTELRHCANATWVQFQFICCAYHSALPQRTSSNDSSQEIRLWQCKETSTINCHLFCWSKHKETPLFLLRGCIFYFCSAAVKMWHHHSSSLLKGCRISCVQISTTTLNLFQGGERATGLGRGGAIGLSLQKPNCETGNLLCEKANGKRLKRWRQYFGYVQSNTQHLSVVRRVLRAQMCSGLPGEGSTVEETVLNHVPQTCQFKFKIPFQSMGPLDHFSISPCQTYSPISNQHITKLSAKQT